MTAPQRNTSKGKAAGHSWKPAAITAGAIVGIVLFLVLGVQLYRSLIRSANDRETKAITAAQELVRERLGSAATADFGPRDLTRVDPDGEMFRVTGWVTASDGASPKKSYRYTCQVYRNPEGSWIGELKELKEQ